MEEDSPVQPAARPLRPDRRGVIEFAWRLAAFLIALAILIIVATRWNRWQGATGWQATDDAYLQADFTPIAAKVAGYVQDVPVQDFQRVRAGQLLVQIVESDYRTTVAQAEAGVAAAVAQVEALRAQQVLQRANVEAARAVVASTSATPCAERARPGAAAHAAGHRFILHRGVREVADHP